MEKEKKEGTLKKGALGIIGEFLGVKEQEVVTVYKYSQPTHDCLMPGHIAVTMKPNGEQFWGVPKEAVTWH